MADQDLIRYARDAASRQEDLFSLLSVDSTASESEIRKAFRRKALTAHPDKAGDAYDPALYERLERARDVLLTPEAREAYDSGMRAVMQKKMQLEQMSEKRRRLVEDLERREEEARRAKNPPPKMPDPEIAAMIARGRAKRLERQRLLDEAEERERLAKEEEAGSAAAGPSAPSTGQPAMDREPEVSQKRPSRTVEELDEIIADLEAQFKEKQQRKAEKQKRKAEKQQLKAEKKARRWSESRWQTPSPERQTSSTPSSHPSMTEALVGNDNTTTAAAAAPSVAPPAGDPPKASNRYAAMYARLRAAQAKKDEEKRRKAEEERLLAAGTAAPPPHPSETEPEVGKDNDTIAAAATTSLPRWRNRGPVPKFPSFKPPGRSGAQE
ncbi:hypothetical protein VTK56DRAFT_7691 [Thermocarpiscus australiensis]